MGVKEMTSANDHGVLDGIDRDEVVQLMKDLQSYRSFSGNETEVMRFLAGWFDERGLPTELVDVSDEPGRPNLVVRIPGSGGGSSLMLNGHLDIDPVPLNYPLDPWDCHEEDGRLTGHGLVNMKAGVAAAAAATVAVHRSGAQLRGDLLFTGVVGELQGGVGAYDLVQRGIGCDYTIICEPSFLDVRTMHSGACQYVITVTGSSAWIGMLHRSEYVNAVNVMADVVKALDNVEFSAQPHPATPGLPRMVIGAINGGVGTDFLKWRASYVADYCAVIIEVRGVPGQDWEQTQADIDRVLEGVRAANPGAVIEIAGPPATYTDDWRSMKVPGHGIDTPIDHMLPQAVARHHAQVTGNAPERIGPQDPGSFAWTDAGWFERGGTVPVVYGPTSNTERTIAIDNVLTVARVLALTAVDICG